MKRLPNFFNRIKNFSVTPKTEERFIQLVFSVASLLTLRAATIIVDDKVSHFQQANRKSIEEDKKAREWNEQRQKRMDEFQAQKDAFEKSLQNQDADEINDTSSPTQKRF